MRIVPFEDAHFLEMQIQDEQKEMEGYKNKGFCDGVKEKTYSILDENGICICLIGFVDFWIGRSMVFCIIDKRLKTKDASSLYKIGKKLVDEYPSARIETTVRVGFEPGMRLSRALGMKEEGIMKKYYVDGTDHVLFARIK